VPPWLTPRMWIDCHRSTVLIR